MQGWTQVHRMTQGGTQETCAGMDTDAGTQERCAGYRKRWRLQMKVYRKRKEKTGGWR